jgi:hypothetical protein
MKKVPMSYSKIKKCTYATFKIREGAKIRNKIIAGNFSSK